MMGIALARRTLVLASALFAVLFAALVFAPPAYAERVEVSGIRYWSYEGYTRVVIDLSGNAHFTKDKLKEPARLFIDLMGSRLTDEVLRKVQVNDGLLQGIRAGQYKNDTVRVVLDLGKVESYKVFSVSGPPRLVIDVYGPIEIERSSTRRIVVDAGHGGYDPGAVGPSKLKEKTVVLDIAKRVKRILEKDGGYDVHMTRSTDKYLSLEERTVIANEKNADLFVSVHTNAHNSRKVGGMETYLLNWTDDEQALKVAARENKISVKRMKQARSELGVILASLELQNKRDESLKLAHYVQGSMVGRVRSKYGRVRDLGVKQALFYVLFGARMPSVLVEVSFITNTTEEKRLRSAAYRQRLAEGIASGIKKYFDSLPSDQKVAMR